MRSHSMRKMMLVAALMGAASLGEPLPEPKSPKAPPPPRDPEDISARQRKRRDKLARRAARAHGTTGIVDDPINEEAP